MTEMDESNPPFKDYTNNDREFRSVDEMKSSDLVGKVQVFAYSHVKAGQDRIFISTHEDDGVPEWVGMTNEETMALVRELLRAIRKTKETGQ